MYARWGSFAVGLALTIAPLALGYGAIGPILHDVAMGLLVCVATLGALDWPPLRFSPVAPALWLLWAGRGAGDPRVATAEIAAGALLLLLAPIPSPRRSRRPAPAGERAGVRV